MHAIRIGYTWNGSPRTYVPDFLIRKGHDVIVEEIKGYEDADKLSAKLAALEQFCIEQECSYSYLDQKALEQLVHAKYNCSIGTLRNREAHQ
jgi:hypothetical protein